MLQVLAVGHLGADAVIQVADGREFLTFRIAHSRKYKDANNQVHESTQWIDCVMNGRPAVAQYLVRGQQVYISGDADLRVYDSAKDHCKKAGIQVRVQRLELLGGPKSNENQQADDDPDKPF